MTVQERVYRAVLWFYPRPFRREVAPELLAAFRRSLELTDRRHRYFARELADLLLNLPAEWWTSLRDGVQAREGGIETPRSSLGNLPLDIRFALRGLRRRPGFTATAVAVLGVGIGATTVIFTVFNAVLLRPLPYPDSQRLVTVWQTREAWAESPNPLLRSFAHEFPLAWDTYQDWSELNSCFEALGVHTTPRTYVLAGAGFPELVVGAEATSSLFETLAVLPALGRVLVPSDDALGTAPVAVLSQGLWRSRFGGDSTAVGRTILLDEVSHTIVGVMPASFTFPSPATRIWSSVPDHRKNPEAGQTLWAIARLRASSSLERAQAEMEAVQQHISERVPAHSRFGVRVVDRRETTVGDARAVLTLLLAAAGLLLLVTSANIANLLLMRASERRHELSVRTALGAGQSRLVVQLLTESVLLALMGGGLGLVLSVASLEPMVAFLPPELPRAGEIRVDATVFIVAAIISLGTGILMGTLPALRASRAPAARVLSDSGTRTTDGPAGQRAQRGIVVAEVAVSFVLVVGAGLLTRSLHRISAIDLGFDAEHVVSAELSFSGGGLGDPEQRRQAVQQLQERLRALPGVHAVSSSAWVPFVGNASGGNLHFMGTAGPEAPNVGWNHVGESYFDVLGVPMISGRAFASTDMVGGATTAIVSESLARAYWPGEDPVGQRIGRESDLDLTIIGVAADIRHPGRGSDQTTEPRSLVYLPREANGMVSVGVTGDPSGILFALPDLAREVDAGLLVTPHLLGDRVRATLAGPRSRTRLLGVMALLAGLLACMGVYGVLSFAVTQRTHEIGIRRALGASAGAVLASVFGEGILLIGSGLALGVLVTLTALIVFPVPEHVLYQVHLTDPTIILAAALLLGLAGSVATAIPAVRAVGLDPGATLKPK